MQREELEEPFSDEIDRGKTVTMQDDRKRMIGITSLSPLCVTTARLKQATNFVNYLARKMSNTTAPDSDADVGEKVSEWLDKFDDPVPDSTTGRLETGGNSPLSMHLLYISIVTLHQIHQKDLAERASIECNLGA